MKDARLCSDLAINVELFHHVLLFPWKARASANARTCKSQSSILHQYNDNKWQPILACRSSSRTDTIAIEMLLRQMKGQLSLIYRCLYFHSHHFKARILRQLQIIHTSHNWGQVSISILISFTRFPHNSKRWVQAAKTFNTNCLVYLFFKQMKTKLKNNILAQHINSRIFILTTSNIIITCFKIQVVYLHILQNIKFTTLVIL